MSTGRCWRPIISSTRFLSITANEISGGRQWVGHVSVLQFDQSIELPYVAEILDYYRDRTVVHITIYVNRTQYAVPLIIDPHSEPVKSAVRSLVEMSEFWDVVRQTT